MEERKLVERAQAGSEDAFSALVERYRMKMFNLAYSLTRSRETADDLAQEIFIKVYLALSKFKFQSEFGTWLYRIGINSIRDHLRKEGRMRKIPLEEDSPHVGTQEEESEIKEAQQEEESRRRLVYKALRALPKKHQAILGLRDIQGFPYGEIAKILDISPGTVDSRLHRARKMLRKKVLFLSAQTGGHHEM